MSTIFQPPPSNLTTIASIMTSEIQTGKASIQWMSPEHEKSLLSNFLLLSFCLPAAASVNLTFGLFYLSHQHRWPAPDRKLSPSNGKETTIFLALTNQSCQNTVSWTSWNRVHTLWKWRKFECSFAVYNLPPYCASPFWGRLGESEDAICSFVPRDRDSDFPQFWMSTPDCVQSFDFLSSDLSCDNDC